MKLNRTAKTYITVQYSDLEDFIKDVCGKYLSVAELEDCNNGTNLYFDVPCPYASGGLTSRAEAFLYGDAKEPVGVRYLLHVLHQHGAIPAGKYLIDVSW